jgi:two-component system response regulator ChvI
MDKGSNDIASVSNMSRLSPALFPGELGFEREPRGSGAIAGPAVNAVLVDSDDTFRESVRLSLARYGIQVTSFESSASVLKYIASNNSCDVIIVDLELQERPGLAFLVELRRSGVQLPVMVLTNRTEHSALPYEEAAFECGADDFLEKWRGLTVLARRIALIAKRAKGPSIAAARDQALAIGSLEILARHHRVVWRGTRIPLTVTEFKMVHMLALSAGEAVSYRDMYDLVHGVNFVAGDGSDGYRVNVRSTIRRTRKKFRAVDDDFSEIENFPGYGYRWRNAGP